MLQKIVAYLNFVVSCSSMKWCVMVFIVQVDIGFVFDQHLYTFKVSLDTSFDQRSPMNLKIIKRRLIYNVLNIRVDATFLEENFQQCVFAFLCAVLKQGVLVLFRVEFPVQNV